MISGRGYLKEGYFADITVFDKNTIGPGASDEGRPTGISYVMVNGALAVDNGAYTGKNDAGALLLQKEND